jgi:hypothetical protein
MIEMFQSFFLYSRKVTSGIALADITAMLFSIFPLNRLKQAREEQADLRAWDSCTEQIFVLKVLFQQCHRYRLTLILIFVDFTTAFDSIKREAVWHIQEEDGMPLHFVELL